MAPDMPEHLRRNREVWDDWATDYAAWASGAWATNEFTWGKFTVPGSKRRDRTSSPGLVPPSLSAPTRHRRVPALPLRELQSRWQRVRRVDLVRSVQVQSEGGTGPASPRTPRAPGQERAGHDCTPIDATDETPVSRCLE